MSITSSYRHKVEDGIEQYAFQSALNPKQRHFIDRCDGEPWELSIVDHHDPFSREEAATLIRELEALTAFMDELNRPDLRRNTEPGEPDLDGRGGGL